MPLRAALSISTLLKSSAVMMMALLSVENRTNPIKRTASYPRAFLRLSKTMMSIR
jgi:hypothetical protein